MFLGLIWIDSFGLDHRLALWWPLFTLKTWMLERMEQSTTLWCQVTGWVRDSKLKLKKKTISSCWHWAMKGDYFTVSYLLIASCFRLFAVFTKIMAGIILHFYPAVFVPFPNIVAGFRWLRSLQDWWQQRGDPNHKTFFGCSSLCSDRCRCWFRASTPQRDHHDPPTGAAPISTQTSLSTLGPYSSVTVYAPGEKYTFAKL